MLLYIIYVLISLLIYKYGLNYLNIGDTSNNIMEYYDNDKHTVSELKIENSITDMNLIKHPVTH